MYATCLCSVMWLLVETSGFASGQTHTGVSTFTAVMNRNGSFFCANDSPVKSISVPSLEDCSWNCIVSPQCENFNYNNQTRECDVFFDKVSTLVLRPHCSHYQMFKWKPRDCDDILRQGFKRSGIYVIYPLIAPNMTEMKLTVHCDLQTGGRGWIVFQRRVDGTENFFRGWNDYKNGFGNLSSEFWIGNDVLYSLTSARRFKLRVDLQDFDLQTRYAEYTKFSVNSPKTNYKLTIGGYTGDAGDCLTNYHNQMMFSTFDSDRDARSASNCAAIYHGGWWYNEGHCSELNGDYLGGVTTIFARGIDWYVWQGHYYSLKFSEMKIAPID